MINFRIVLFRVLFMVVAVVALASPSFAFKIEEVTSPGGIRAWLVPNKSIPLIAMQFSFRGGSVHDPKGKEGVTNFLTGMLDEGAAELDSAAFQKLRDELSFKMSFRAGLDTFTGSFQTLTSNRDASYDLLRKVLTEPRFEADPLERVRQQFLQSIQEQSEDPEQIASSAWMELVLPGDPYARETMGTLATVSAITAEDLSEVHRRTFNRKTLQIAVVGDIDASALGPLLDHVFGGLPEGEEPLAIPAPRLSEGPLVKVISREIPQSIIVFGHGGIKRNDPDFIPAYLMSEILGGGSFGTRLTTEIREKRGLTYGVSAGLVPMNRIGLFMGSLGTRNEKAGESIALVKQELQRMAQDGPTAKELDEAKTYQTGSYALRFDSNAAIASQLLGIQQENLGIDYVEKRNSRVEAVTLEQVKAQAKRILNSDKLIVTIVGKPEGLTN